MSDDPVSRLLAVRERPRRIVIGLLSGTSADGTDAALCEIAGFGENTGLVARAFVTTPFPRPLRERIYRVSQADASELTDLDVMLGEAFADGARAVADAAGVAMTDVDLIGSHGQTAVHHPRSAGQLGATLQIGEAAVIAERTGCPVVSDFRVRDVAAGGEGAPLVPLVDHLLFRKPGRRRALQNIGGIANVTLVSERLDDLVAFDNGPGNMPLDTVARAASQGREAFDRDGARAARGDIDDGLLTELHRHPYLSQRAAEIDGTRDVRQGLRLPVARALPQPPRRPARDADAVLRRGDRAQLPRDAAGDARRGVHFGRRCAEPDADAPPHRAAGAGARRDQRRAGRRPGGEGGDRVRGARQPDAVRRSPATSPPSPARSGRASSEKSHSERAGVQFPQPMRCASIATSSIQAVNPGGAVW